MAFGLVWRLILGIVIAALYVVACASHAYQFAADRQHFQSQVLGINLLFWGWLGVFYGQIGWYANLPFFVASILFVVGEYRISWWVALGAGLIASTSLVPRTFHCSTPHGSTEIPIVGYGLGLYAWLGAFLVLFFAVSFFQLIQKRYPAHPMERDKEEE